VGGGGGGGGLSKYFIITWINFYYLFYVRMSYNIEIPRANVLLGRYFPEVKVDKRIIEGKPVFTTHDNDIIVKFVQIINDPTIIDSTITGLKKYLKWSNPTGESFCNICKLLHYQKFDGNKFIIVMENCGQDLFELLRHDTHDTGVLNTKRFLQLSLELLKQIICLQNIKKSHDTDEFIGVVHGDIKPENIAVKVNKSSGDLEVKLIDFDDLGEIMKVGEQYEVKVRNITAWLNNETSPVYFITTLSKFKYNFIRFFLTVPGDRNKHSTTSKLDVRYNIPTALGDFISSKLDSKEDGILTGSLDYLHIIDLCSWCYVVAFAIMKGFQYSIFNEKIDSSLFVWNVLVAIVMNIIIPNHNQPLDPPVDCFNRVINKEYCDKVVNGISVLLRLLAENYDPIKKYSHSKAKLFFDLIQVCRTEDELSLRFKDIISKNEDFYNTIHHIKEQYDGPVEEGSYDSVDAAFQTITIHIRGDGVSAEAGGGYTRNNKKKSYKRNMRKGKMKSRKLRMKKKKKTLRV
jgi:serine/threonine protein kinase